MKRFNVKLDKWTSPLMVEARNKETAQATALQHYPTCDCCEEPPLVESVTETQEKPRLYQRVLMEVRK